MVKPIRFKRWLIILLLLIISISIYSSILSTRKEPGIKKDQNAEISKPRKFTNREDNKICLGCHANNHIRIRLAGADKDYVQRMYSDCIIDTVAYSLSNHWNFKCIDCHSDEYDSFPHNPLLRFEPISECLDCHGNDPNYSKYHFETIQTEFEKSVHSTKHAESFSCWSCHDSHYYKINARNRKQDIQSTIVYDNSICLSCHADKNKYQLISDKLKPTIIKTHAWLPNQADHFAHVRCIECHAELNDSLLVAHNILPKSRAVKKCVECHSADSRLKASLYKYRLEGKGMFGDERIGNTVLIGSPKSSTVNILSIVLLFGSILGILVHMLLRIIKRK